MEGKSSDWVRGPSGPTVCRCCFAEGCYKDISTEYFWMGKREVYAEMLTETFDLSIAFAQAAGTNSNSRLICEPCISRLRDASEFKRQVQECEKMFMEYLDPGRIVGLEIEMEINPEPEKEVKLERVKLEKNPSDDEFDDRSGFDDMDEDELDDQPLTKLASKVPKKESVDLLDLLDNAKAEKRKSTSKAKASPAKKAKAKKETPKATASKVKPEKKKKEYEQAAARQNGQLVVTYTTAYPFKLPENDMVCVYCCETYQDPSQYRKHMEDEHKTFKVNIAFVHCYEGYIKVDITDLRCRICEESLPDLKTAANHLKNIHNDPYIDLNFEVGLQPFKLIDNINWTCAVCEIKAFSLRQLSRHTQTHFSKLTCDICDKGYPTPSSLRQHVQFVHFGRQRICRKCRQTFDTAEEKHDHLTQYKMCRQYCCMVCGDRFILLKEKIEHMSEKHGAPEQTFPCPQCNEVFMGKNKLSDHFRVAHAQAKHICNYCGRNYKYKNSLDRHVVVHTQEKAYVCGNCSKTFHRKSNLVQHMWIHRI